MVKVNTLSPHDPMPSGPNRQVVVLRRFEEDNPGRTTVEIVLTGSPEEITHPRQSDGSAMSFDDAISAAKRVAESEGIDSVFVLDRMQGKREHEILAHQGDHSTHGEGLSDVDAPDGEQGPDMRDIVHPARET